MSIEVIARKDSEGWVLLTADEFSDIVAGPYNNISLLSQEALDMDLAIVSGLESVNPPEDAKPVPVAAPRKRAKRIPKLKPGDLFRVDAYWYRLVNYDDKECLCCAVVGEDRNEKLRKDTEITEVSVLSLT